MELAARAFAKSPEGQAERKAKLAQKKAARAAKAGTPSRSPARSPSPALVSTTARHRLGCWATWATLPRAVLGSLQPYPGGDRDLSSAAPQVNAKKTPGSKKKTPASKAKRASTPSRSPSPKKSSPAGAPPSSRPGGASLLREVCHVPWWWALLFSRSVGLGVGWGAGVISMCLLPASLQCIRQFVFCNHSLLEQ